MFYLMMYTQYILFTVIWKDAIGLVNNALNTFYLQLYGIGIC